MEPSLLSIYWLHAKVTQGVGIIELDSESVPKPNYSMELLSPFIYKPCTCICGNSMGCFGIWD